MTLLVGGFSVASLWYGGRYYFVVLLDARHGILNVPMIVIAAAELWAGLALGLLAGTLGRKPPGLPDRPSLIGVAAVVFIAVLIPVLSRRPEVEARLPDRVRRKLDGRYIALGAVLAAIGMAFYGSR